MTSAGSWAAARRAAGISTTATACAFAICESAPVQPPPAVDSGQIDNLGPSPSADAVGPRDQVKEPQNNVRSTTSANRSAVAFQAIGRRVAYKDIKGDRENELIRQCKNGDRRAGETLLLAHAPLIARVVKRSMHRSHHDLEPGDLLSEAQLGFLEGVRRFDFSAGTRLSTYALYWARAYTGRSAGDTGSTIRVPIHAQDSLKKNSDTKSAQRAKNAFGTCSLHAFLETEEGDVALHRSIADDSPLQDERIANNESVVLVRRALDDCKLTAIEKEIVSKRVMSDEPETLDSIGQRFDLSRERIRQLEQSAINKIRKSYDIVAKERSNQ